MQVKKFEAPTIQEALEVIKRELGPEAIILQTRKMKKGFGLMSRESVEVTAAVSERSIQKKAFAENRLRETDREAVKKLPANRQGDLYDKYVERHEARAATRPAQQRDLIDERAQATRERIEIGKGSRAAPQAQAPAASQQKRLTATRYVDIDDHPESQASAARRRTAAPDSSSARAGAQVPGGVAPGPGAREGHQARTLEDYAQGRVSREAVGAAMGQPGAEMTVEEELRHLKRMIEEMKTTQDTAAPAVGGAAAAASSGLSTPALQDAFEQLVINGIERRFALSLVKKVAFEIGEERSRNPEYVLDQLAVEVMQSTEIVSALGGIEPGVRAGATPAVIALVGPTGVGKTTTVAKLASEALLKRGLKVGLINLDSYKVAAFDQLGTYAKILNVPFRSAETVDDLRVAIRDFNALDVVLIDTTGRSQRDPGSLKEMHAMLQAVPGIRTQLVLSVTTRDNELYDQANRFALFRPQGIIVSKLDEAAIYGSIYNVSHRAKLPLLYFTTGQRVPEDIEEATRERVAALIMDL